MRTADQEPGPLQCDCAAVELRGVGLTRAGRELLDNIHLTVNSGERWVVIGPNGAGKTSLLSIVGAYQQPSRGVATVLGSKLGTIDLRQLRTRIAHHGAAILNRIPDHMRAQDVVITARYAALGMFRHHEYGDDDWARAKACLEELGVGHAQDRAYGSLSEGERQRVLIARALMTEPELLLFDEPAAALDLAGREQLLVGLQRIGEDASSPPSILVTHHVEEIPPGFGHALILRAGRVVASGPTDQVITSAILSDAYDIEVRVEYDEGRFRAWAPTLRS